MEPTTLNKLLGAVGGIYYGLKLGLQHGFIEGCKGGIRVWTAPLPKFFSLKM